MYRDYGRYNHYYDPWGYGGFGLGYFYYSPWAWYPAYYGYGYGGGYGYGSGYRRALRPHGYDLGRVKLKVKPRDAEVFVDNYYAGSVDDFDGFLQALKLDSGGYRIEIRKPGFETLHFDVRVQPDRTITFRGEMKPTAVGADEGDLRTRSDEPRSVFSFFVLGSSFCRIPSCSARSPPSLSSTTSASAWRCSSFESCCRSGLAYPRRSRRFTSISTPSLSRRWVWVPAADTRPGPLSRLHVDFRGGTEDRRRRGVYARLPAAGFALRRFCCLRSSDGASSALRWPRSCGQQLRGTKS